MATLIFLQPFSKMWIYVSFKINQDKIAKTLCVKKEVKNNGCQGKCHLKKQLDKADENEQKQAPTNLKEKYEVLYCDYHRAMDLRKLSLLLERQILNTNNADFFASSFITDIFRPPKLNLI